MGTVFYKLPASSTPLRFQDIYLYCSFSLRYETTAKPMGNKLPATIKHHPAKSLGPPILPQRTHHSVRKFPMLLLLPLQVQSSPKKTCFFLVLPYTMISEPPKKPGFRGFLLGAPPCLLSLHLLDCGFKADFSAGFGAMAMQRSDPMVLVIVG